ncbi:energy-coupling factor ABC transporter ATP-binding protein [Cytobacillus spongiae]|uniref:energy-coupling factor ABC transporter ATP-binding protein n=1 Tax=Cytobacillus spongiae TaxID=2901381 RepID=UPI001F1813C5|nr:energy-coupling factor ABC transporter ATP-binding protein [Cytobacillus spongiae]UII56103.1 energy-coupling factor ABC transporter ATP-binding protein [Cytobacillus spongiae]
MKEKLVSIKDVSFQYDQDGPFALKNVSFDIYNGEWLALVGHNGSGKSTLAKLLNGLQFPTGGEILVDGVKLSEDSIWDIRRKIGMVFQNPDNQFVGTTVKDDVAFGLENNGIPREDMVKRVYESLELVNMGSFLEQEPHHLSGGQKQRVAIAGVIALRPDLIILDEATSMLDPRGREEVLNIVRKLKDDHKLTVVSITHDLEEAAKADRMIVMNKGVVYREGTPEDIFQLDEELVQLGLDIPFPVKISKNLKQKGIALSKHFLTEEELVTELWTSHLNK